MDTGKKRCLANEILKKSQISIGDTHTHTVTSIHADTYRPTTNGRGNISHRPNSQTDTFTHRPTKLQEYMYSPGIHTHTHTHTRAHTQK